MKELLRVQQTKEKTIRPLNLVMGALFAVTLAACGSGPLEVPPVASAGEAHLTYYYEPPRTAQTDVPLSFFSVELRDSKDNLITEGEEIEVRLSIVQGGALLGGDYSQQLQGGRAAFDGIVLAGTGEVTLTVTAEGIRAEPLAAMIEVAPPPDPELPALPSEFTEFDAGPASLDGRYVSLNVYELPEGMTRYNVYIYIFDRVKGESESVSVNSRGEIANDESYRPALSSDGRFVAFESYASNLVEGDSNGTWDIFVRDRQSGTTTRVSRTARGGELNGDSWMPTISSNGRFIEFYTTATNAGVVTASPRLFLVYDQLMGTVSVSDGQALR